MKKEQNEFEKFKISLLGSSTLTLFQTAKELQLSLKGKGLDISIVNSNSLLEERLEMNFSEAFQTIDINIIKFFEGQIIREFSQMQSGILIFGSGAPYPHSAYFNQQQVQYHYRINRDNLSKNYVVGLRNFGENILPFQEILDLDVALNYSSHRLLSGKILSKYNLE
jgi:hypothetical protein